MIRQECITSVDRGELLIRIRDEFISTIQSYKQMFADCLMFSTREIRTVS